jgi:hypothetical protein
MSTTISHKLSLQKEQMRGISEFIGIKYAFQNFHSVRKFCILYDNKLLELPSIFQPPQSTYEKFGLKPDSGLT